MNYLQNKNNEKKLKWILFIMLFALSMALATIKNITEYPYDSQYYWTVADGVFIDGFNILNFPETFRGYFFSLLVSAFKLLFDGVWGWRILSSICISACFAFSLPYLLKQRSVSSYREMIGVLLAYCMFIWIWGDFVQYPLSDFFASTFMISGVCLLIMISKNCLSLKVEILMGIGAGVLLYASYNTRAAFLYGVIAALILFLIVNRKEIKKIIVVMLALIIGMLMIALPQCAINKQYTGSFSPKVFSEQLYNYDHDLQSQQVFWGLTNPKYDTYIGDTELYPTPQVQYYDPIGEEIVCREDIVIEDFSITDVFKLFCKYPIDMIGIYTRHVISLLTPSSNETYITQIYNNKGFVASISIILWIIAGIAILSSIKKVNVNVLWILVVFIPSLLQLFGGAELRFFLPIYMVGYIYIFEIIDYREVWNSIKDRWISVLIVAVIIYVLWISSFGDILSFNIQKTLLINDSEETMSEGICK